MTNEEWEAKHLVVARAAHAANRVWLGAMTGFLNALDEQCCETCRGARLEVQVRRAGLLRLVKAGEVLGLSEPSPVAREPGHQ